MSDRNDPQNPSFAPYVVLRPAAKATLSCTLCPSTALFQRTSPLISGRGTLDGAGSVDDQMVTDCAAWGYELVRCVEVRCHTKQAVYLKRQKGVSGVYVIVVIVVLSFPAFCAF